MTIPTLTDTQEEALVAVCLFAAFADAEKSDNETAEVSRLAVGFRENLSTEVSQKILTGRLSLNEAAAALVDADQRRAAYEMAVGVCEADGHLTESERAFLDDLQTRFGLSSVEAADEEKAVSEVALAPAETPQAVPASDNQGMILRYAIVNGALELLPDTMATLAIIPLQMKMVYRIGKSHGVNLDTGHIKELLAAAGIGMTSQVVEGFVRKFAKQLATKFRNQTVQKIADHATGTAFSFASTYALGVMADKYYAGGRTMLPDQVREGFQSLLATAREKYTGLLPQIQERAKTLDSGKIVGLLKDPDAV
jgi:uncharacterized protein (DUF697 family)/tellurite resistance protein